MRSRSSSFLQNNRQQTLKQLFTPSRFVLRCSACSKGFGLSSYETNSFVDVFFNAMSADLDAMATDLDVMAT